MPNSSLILERGASLSVEALELMYAVAPAETATERDSFDPDSDRTAVVGFAGSIATENADMAETPTLIAETQDDTSTPNLTLEDKIFGRLDAPLTENPTNRPPRRWLRAAATVLSGYVAFSAWTALPAAASQAASASRPNAEEVFIRDGNQQVTRDNYAGLALRTAGNIEELEESFTVPNITCTPGAEALIYVGMSGSITTKQSTNIEQIELYGKCGGGRHPHVTYSGDVEILPEEPEPIFITAEAGQEVEMDITHQGRGPGDFIFNAENISNGTGEQITLPCPPRNSCARNFALGVVERLKNGLGNFIAFPRVGATAFMHMQVRQNNGSLLGLNTYENRGQVTQINMVSGSTDILNTSGPDPMNEGYVVARP